MRYRLSLLLLCSLLGGCALPPSLPVLGAYFPDWLFCAIGAAAATLVVNALLAHVEPTRRPGPPLLLNGALLLLFSLALWLLLFQS